MKPGLLILLWLLSCSTVLIGQPRAEDKLLSTYLKEVKASTSANKNLWGIDLYAPILFVEPQTRKVFANEQDSAKILKGEAGIFVGDLPVSVNIANTSVRWSGKQWAMIMLPLSENKNERLNLITHELFHRGQAQLHFKTTNVDNDHLDKKEGRIYLRLEMEALRKAVESKSEGDAKGHILNAVVFRKVRHHLYAHADSTENLLELNEGLAEYTGLVMSGRTKGEIVQHFTNSIDQFQKNKTFVRSFANQTIPLYGYVTSQYIRKLWNKEITMDTDLIDYFIAAFKITVPTNLDEHASRVSPNYFGEQITREEELRNEANLKLVNELVTKFVKSPHFEIDLEKMNISFNPSNIISLDSYGTVYPTMRVTDNWGILTVEDGALMSRNWKKITITIPAEINGKVIKGQGWTLDLNDSYTVLKNPDTSNYRLEKK